MAKSFNYHNLMYTKYSVTTRYTKCEVILSLTPWLSLLTPEWQRGDHLIFSVLVGHVILVQGWFFDFAFLQKLVCLCVYVRICSPETISQMPAKADIGDMPCLLLIS